MNKKRWIGAAAVFFGLLLAALGVFILGFTDRADDERETEIRQAETAAKPEIYIEHDPLAEEPEPGMEETEASEEDSASGDEPVRMVFAGDILLSAHVLKAYTFPFFCNNYRFAGLFQIPSGSHMVNPGLIQGIAGIQKGVRTKIKRMVICQGHKIQAPVPGKSSPSQAGAGR